MKLQVSIRRVSRLSQAWSPFYHVWWVDHVILCIFNLMIIVVCMMLLVSITDVWAIVASVEESLCCVVMSCVDEQLRNGLMLDIISERSKRSLIPYGSQTTSTSPSLSAATLSQNWFLKLFLPLVILIKQKQFGFEGFNLQLPQGSLLLLL